MFSSLLLYLGTFLVGLVGLMIAAPTDPKMTGETTAFSNRLKPIRDDLNTTDANTLRQIFGNLDQEQDRLYRKKNKNLYDHVIEQQINGAFNPNDNYQIPLTLFKPKHINNDAPVVIYFHGGGFFLGDIVSFGPTLTHLAAELKIRIVFVDYRLAPEYPYPTASNDCLAAASYIASNKATLFSSNAKLFVMGDSAGGNFALFVANEITKVQINGLILIYPAVSFRQQDLFPLPSFTQFTDPKYIMPIITPAVFANYLIPAMNNYGPSVVDQPQMSPILGVSQNTPSTLVINVELDPIRDQGQIVLKNGLSDDNVNCETHLIDGTIHLYFQYPLYFPKAFEQTISLIEDYIF